jgi:hypothetical protein
LVSNTRNENGDISTDHEDYKRLEVKIMNNHSNKFDYFDKVDQELIVNIRGYVGHTGTW